MEELNIVKNYMDRREFRNYVTTMLSKHNYEIINIDDVRISDEDKYNNNDIIVKKDNKKYTVQTFLNKEITDKHIEATLKDMDKEKVSYGLIVTNFNVNDDIKNKTKKKKITILDRKEFGNGIYN